MKSKYLKIIVMSLVLLVSVLAGLTFNFPRSWNWNFVSNFYVMAKTFLTLSIGVSLLTVSNSFDKYVKNRGGK